MIHYQLQCSRDHGFDGWFKDSAAFEAQARRGLLECPVCGDIKVDRALMAPAVPKKGRPFRAPEAAPAAAPAEPPAQPVAVAPERLPDHVRALLQRMRAEVEKHCDYVGDNFADEARRIHTGESEARGIYGEATPDEAEALAEDGIEIASIPWVPRADG
ncbi:MAG: hypothetical protein BGP12_03700 [Rhodospirillales bacterium 70-18]|nr:DUF1178 family protein [Rhodospirillales bacterium]OJY64854.1 MAG: hypothetical protein BGP12_03700 [Rhodospirillales bacterium 70-18]